MLSEIFKAYDVRGVFNKNFLPSDAYKIGKAFISFLKCKEIIVGYDMRLSSPELAKAFIQAVLETGADVIDIGLVSTDALYFASGFLNKPGVIFTASHNPPQYNGIKFCDKGATPLNQDRGLNEIKTIAEKTKFIKFGSLRTIKKKNILAEFGRHVTSFIDKDKLKKLVIVADAANGMAGKIIPLVYDNLPVKIIPLFFDLNGNFPNHPADPSDSKNLKELQSKVKKEKADFGMAFDGDADRVFFVDENSNVVNSSIISSLLIKNILKKHNNQKIVYNIVCSRIVPETINKYKGYGIVERVGHSFIKETMRHKNAVFGCEHSGHYYFRDNYYADSGIIASLMLCEILSKEQKPLSKLISEFSKYSHSGEINFIVDNKNKKLNQIENYFKEKKPVSFNKIDGLSFDFGDYWFNARASNTEPFLRLNIEAKSRKLLDKTRKELEIIIKD